MIKSKIKNGLNIVKHESKQLKYIIYRSFYIKKSMKKEITNNFHRLYYDSLLFGETHGNTFWLGVPIYKCPMDMIIYQEIIHETKPDLIIECGTKKGGSALFMASICELLNHGQVISIDILKGPDLPQHERITYLYGSSVSEEIIEEVKKIAHDKKRVMVILDSDHRMEHVIEELKVYNTFVTVGNYMIVEDTNMNGNPVAQEFGPGPMEAIDTFMKTNKNFVVDEKKEKLLLTFNPKGYLLRSA